MKKMMKVTKNLIGCGEMKMSNTFTFSLTITDEVAGSAPMTEEEAIDYIVLRLESQSVISVTNIVRDY